MSLEKNRFRESFFPVLIEKKFGNNFSIGNRLCFVSAKSQFSERLVPIIFVFIQISINLILSWPVRETEGTKFFPQSHVKDRAQI